MPWLEVHDDCAKAEDVMARAMAVAERRRAGFVASPVVAEPAPTSHHPDHIMTREEQRNKLIECLITLKKTGPIVPRSSAKIIERIQDEVSDYFGISVEDILSEKRFKHLVTPRHISFFLARKLTVSTFSVASIARAFDRDHSTVLYALRRFKPDANVIKIVAEIEERVLSI